MTNYTAVVAESGLLMFVCFCDGCTQSMNFHGLTVSFCTYNTIFLRCETEHTRTTFTGIRKAPLSELY